MVGILEYKEGRGRRPAASAETLGGLPCLRVEIPAAPGLAPARLARRVDKGARLLIRAGVRRVLTAADFPWWPRLEARGLGPVDPTGLCQALAASLALAALERQGSDPARSTVVLAGRWAAPPLLQAAEALCPRVRRLCLAVPGEEELLTAWLWEEFGAACVPAEALGQVEVVLRFTPGAWERTGRAELTLYGPRPDLAGLSVGLPVGCSAGGLEELPVAALLWEAGRLEAEELLISST